MYLGLKVGLTFATSIPAAVISMAVLRLFKSSSIFENNIVQTVASAAGTLAAIIFVLPGLVIVGWWHGFPYWMTMAATGPRRNSRRHVLRAAAARPGRQQRLALPGRALPRPKCSWWAISRAKAIAESRQGLVAITVNSVVSAAFFALSQTRLAVDEAAVYFRVGASSTGVSASLSMALVGVGHLVGLSVGMAMFAGILIGWGILVPCLTAALPATESARHAALAVFGTDLRFFGAGVIGVAALWTFSRILGPIVTGLRSAMAASSARGVQGGLPLVERDLPVKIVGAVVAVALV